MSAKFCWSVEVVGNCFGEDTGESSKVMASFAAFDDDLS